MGVDNFSKLREHPNKTAGIFPAGSKEYLPKEIRQEDYTPGPSPFMKLLRGEVGPEEYAKTVKEQIKKQDHQPKRFF